MLPVCFPELSLAPHPHAEESTIRVENTRGQDCHGYRVTGPFEAFDAHSTQHESSDFACLGVPGRHVGGLSFAGATKGCEVPKLECKWSMSIAMRDESKVRKRLVYPVLPPVGLFPDSFAKKCYFLQKWASHGLH